MLAEEALVYFDDILNESELDSYKHALLVYSGSLGLYSMGGTKIPDPPTPPEWLNNDDDFEAAR